MKILILGKKGKVGSELYKMAKKLHHKVIAVDRKELDICNHKKVKTYISNLNPDLVINATAYTDVDKAESDEKYAFAVNSLAVNNLAKVCEEISSILIHISTDYIFSGDKDGAYKESDLGEPRTVYGLSKLDGEKAVIKYCTNYFIIRTSWVFGQNGKDFVKTISNLLKKQEPINIVCDQKGAPTSASGISKIIIKLIKFVEEGNENWGIYHYSGYPYVSWYEYALTIKEELTKIKLYNGDVEINAVKSKEFEMPAKRPFNSMLDCKKINKVFGIEPENWRESLSQLFKNHYKLNDDKLNLDN